MNIKIFKTQKKFQKENLNEKPYFFWKLVLSAMSIIILASFGFGYYIFLQSNKEVVLTEADLGGTLETVNTGRLDGVLEYFNAREKKSEQVINSPSPVIDPSL